jgi:hypothetical protein
LPRRQQEIIALSGDRRRYCLVIQAAEAIAKADEDATQKEVKACLAVVKETKRETTSYADGRRF